MPDYGNNRFDNWYSLVKHVWDTEGFSKMLPVILNVSHVETDPELCLPCRVMTDDVVYPNTTRGGNLSSFSYVRY